MNGIEKIHYTKFPQIQVIHVEKVCQEMLIKNVGVGQSFQILDDFFIKFIELGKNWDQLSNFLEKSFKFSNGQFWPILLRERKEKMGIHDV